MPGAWTRSAIESLADPRSFMRGLTYEAQGRVEIEARGGNTITAVVRGTRPYRVELRRARYVAWSCTCPVGEDGHFCKHCVAVALAVAEPDVETTHLRRTRDAEVDLRVWKKQIDAAFGDGRHFVAYAEAGSWAAGIFEVIAALDDLVDAGHATDVIGLAEHAHRRADAVQYVDDSDGWLTDISGRLGTLHLRACESARPDPVELAGRLAELELTSELPTFHRAAATYSSVLGVEGIAAYRRAVEPKWRVAKRHKEPFSQARFATTEAMIGIAQAAGDPDALIAARGEPRWPGDHLEIAEALAVAGRRDEAIDWARHGLDTFADRHWQTPPLREFLASQLRAADDVGGTEALWWDAFERHPSLDGYRRLLAETADADRIKQASVHLLRTRLDAGDRETRARNPLLERSPATTLVEILLYEGRDDDAWEAATQHGCDEGTWMTVARVRESVQPLDAIPIYERAIAAHIATRQNRGYRDAVDLLARIRNLAATVGEPDRFTELLARVMAEHGRKRNLIALIAEKRWT